MRADELIIKKYVSVFLLFFFLVLFSGCGEVTGKLLVMKANMQASQMSASKMQAPKMQVSQTQYTKAIAAYSEALRFSEAVPYAEYGIALVYLFLGEDEAAFSRFNNAESAMNGELTQKDKELDFRIHYNRGILYFYAGRFAEAASQFRNALEIDGSRIEAKRNLELSLLSLQQQNSSEGSSSLQAKQNDEEENAMFGYLRQKETDAWKTEEAAENQNAPWLDY